MKIEAIHAQDIRPIRNLSISGLEDVVIIAGANGSGKSRLKEAIIQTFQNPSGPQVDLTIRATRDVEEKQRWGTDMLAISQGIANSVFQEYMNSRTRGGAYTGTAIQIDSQRAVTAVQFQTLHIATPDPDDVDIDYRYFLNPFNSRWSDTVNKIYQKVANRGHKLAQYSIEHPDGRIADALSRCPDPFVPYQEIFTKLLPDKVLDPIDPKQQQEFHYRLESDPSLRLPFSTLSSGEQEVVKITFDLLTKRITHCVFLIDEPELHLHSTLAFRLIETLKSIGQGTNQFIFFTHSADLISTYYSTGNVYFIDSVQTDANQAHRLSELDANHQSLVSAMSENLGLFAVGKKLVFVEGQHSSRDRLTYHTIAQSYFPEAHIIPVGPADNVSALSMFGKELSNAIFGIDFFMIRDRDGLTDESVAELEANGKMRCLKRRHLENYFLDPDVLAEVSVRFCIQDVQFRDTTCVDRILQDIARRSLGEALLLNLKEYLRVNRSMEIPTVRSVQTKTVESVEGEFLENTLGSFRLLAERMSEDALRLAFAEERKRLEQSLIDAEWRQVFPGKLVFERYCGQEGINADSMRVRQAYTEIALAHRPTAFQDVIDILASFRS